MPKITVAKLEDAPVVTLPAEQIASVGPVEIRALLAGDNYSVRLFYGFLKSGASLTWNRSGSDFCVSVLKGSISVNGTSIAQGGTVLIEHGGAGSVVADGEATLALFENLEPGHKKGGHVHFIRRENVPSAEAMPDYKKIGGALMADAQCPSCDVWLHGNTFKPNDTTALHSHSEDEVILVTEGEIVLGRKQYGPGTAVAVAKDTIYAFDIGPSGLTYLNFRGAPPFVTPKGGSKLNEGDFFRSQVGSPKHVFIQ